MAESIYDVDLSSLLLPPDSDARIPITLERISIPPPSSASSSSTDSFAYILHNILTPTECANICKYADTSSYMVPVNDGKSNRFVNNKRAVIRSPDLANVIWARIESVLAQVDDHIREGVTILPGQEEDDPLMVGRTFRMEGKWTPSGLNTVWRLCRYDPGGHFGPHRDGVLQLDLNTRSMKTFMFYLNSEFEGGTTNFVMDQEGTGLHVDASGKIKAQEGTILHRVKPTAGMALVFNHGLLHEGEELRSGQKYILRSEILFQRVEPLEISAAQQEAIVLRQRAENLEAQGKMEEAVACYKRAFKLCPEIEKMSM
ncbi:hypothetical protein HK104_006245 [Borealophlyctis nickersoniae]|nr:hypothetical protein HK104_006245 [Borealophlyctis nickersoniae]